jgi:hypothetical protein
MTAFEFEADSVATNGEAFAVTIDRDTCASAPALTLAELEHVIVIAERGWIFEGSIVSLNGDADSAVHLTDANVVRSWSNGKGIGGLCKLEFRDGYVLDALGDVFVPRGAVIAVIPITEW